MRQVHSLVDGKTLSAWLDSPRRPPEFRSFGAKSVRSTEEMGRAEGSVVFGRADPGSLKLSYAPKADRWSVLILAPNSHQDTVW